jgi:hypothetical protein
VPDDDQVRYWFSSDDWRSDLGPNPTRDQKNIKVIQSVISSVISRVVCKRPLGTEPMKVPRSLPDRTKQDDLCRKVVASQGELSHVSRW